MASTARYAARISPRIARLGTLYLERFLRPFALVDLNDRAGREVVVEINHGASTGSVAVFTLNEGRLTRMRIEGALDDAFSYGGSAGYGSAVDCILGTPGMIVDSGYGAVQARGEYAYRVTRHFYRGTGTSFVPTGRKLRYRLPYDGVQHRFPEFNGEAFARCPGRIPRMTS